MTMDRTAYLEARLQRDFLKYIILRENGKSAEEIADALEVTASGLMGSEVLRKLRDESSKEMNALVEREFSFDKIKNGDSFVRTLPEGFGPELITKVVDEYRAFLKSDRMAKPEAKVCELLIRKIEKEAWRSGLVNLSAGISLFLERTAAKAREYRVCIRPADYKKELDSLYGKAGKHSLFSNHTDDIIALRSCMKNAAELECGNATSMDVADFLQSIADNGRLKEIAEYADSIVGYAAQLKAKSADIEPDEKLDAEYERIVPIKFYSRNIEKVDEYKAFYMSAMYALARYEDTLDSKGYLSGGEITVFTGFPQKEPSALVSDIISMLTDFAVSMPLR